MLLARSLDKRVIGDTKLLWQTTHKLFSTLKSVKANSCTHNHLKAGTRRFSRMAEVWYGECVSAMLGLRTSPRRWQEHLSWQLKEHGFVQDERDPCLFVNTELDICTGVHVDDMLAVGPSELTKNLLQELSKDMALRWCGGD